MKRLAVIFLLAMNGCVGVAGNYGLECHYQVRGVALWFQAGYGNRFDMERAKALEARSDRDYPDKERLYRYLEQVTCQ